MMPFVLLALVSVLAACAPQARKVEGPVSEAVQRALDSGQATFDHALGCFRRRG